MTRRPFEVAAAAAAAALIAFLALPVAALLTRTSPGALVDALGSGAARDALAVTLVTSSIAHAAVVVIGTPAAYALARSRFRGRTAVLALVELPVVLPPAVAGIALLALFGRFGLLGEVLEVAGIRIAFTQAAVVIAVAFVSAPLYVRQAVAAFEAVDEDVLDAARTLGAHPQRVFARIAVPLAGRGLAAGSALAWARGAGEFGATLMFAGSLPGVTQTLPLALYAQLGRDFRVAVAIGAVLVATSAAVLVVAKVLVSWHSPSTSPSSSVPSLSS